MGQGASAPRRKKKKKSKKSSIPDDAALQKMNEKITMIQQDLIRTKQLGEVNKRSQEDEISKFEMELHKKKYQLHKRGNEAEKYLSFSEYVDIVNVVLHADSASADSAEMTLKQHRAAMKVREEGQKKKAEKGAIVRHAGLFNIYSFFEAVLLRRLHIAMILKHQRAKQSDLWNDIIMFLYDQMLPLVERTKAVNDKYITLKPESNETLREMIKLNKKKMKLYDRMIQNLKEEVEEELMANSIDNGRRFSDNDLEVPKRGVQAADAEEEVNTAKYDQKDGRYDQDDDEMSFKSMSSRKSSLSRRSKRNSKNSATKQAPRWQKSSRSKMSKTINRDLDINSSKSSFRSIDLESSARSARSSRSPSPVTGVSPKAEGGSDTAKITDDDIERFLYPNKPVRTSGKARRKTSVGSMPSELEIDKSNRTAISTLHDSGSSFDSGTGKNEYRAKQSDLDLLMEENF